MIVAARDAEAQAIYGPATPAKPPLAPGSAADPKDDPEAVAPAAPERYPPPAGITGAPLDARDKRAIPKYGAPTNAGDVALVVPRVALTPLYLVSEYLVRRPLGAAIMFAEKHHVAERTLDFLSFGTYGTDHAIGILPTANFEWGIRANAGVLFFWDHGDNSLRASATFGWPDWHVFSLADRFPVGERSTMTAKAMYEKRADFRFWGLGPSSPSRGHYYTLDRVTTELSWFTRLWHSSSFELFAGLRSAKFDADAPGSPDLESGIASGDVVAPPGLDGYVIAYQRAAFALDTRRQRAEGPKDRKNDFVAPPGTGVRIEAHGQHAFELAQPKTRDRGEWVKYGGGVGAYWDVTGLQRTLGLSVSTELLQPIGNTTSGMVPFLELPSLGGMEPLRGFRWYRLLGQSAISAKMSYSWPVWTGFDGILEAALGDVFGDYYEGFSAKLLRGSFVTGLQTTASRYLNFQILLGVGTRTIDDGFSIEAVRFVIGTSTVF